MVLRTGICGLSGFFVVVFAFSELCQGHKHHLFVPLVGIQVKI